MHRVYVEDGEVWTLASVYARRAPLPTDARRMVVFETIRPPHAEEVCVLLDDGRLLCDFGPTHAHSGVLDR